MKPMSTVLLPKAFHFYIRNVKIIITMYANHLAQCVEYIVNICSLNILAVVVVVSQGLYLAAICWLAVNPK